MKQRIIMISICLLALVGASATYSSWGSFWHSVTHTFNQAGQDIKNTANQVGQGVTKAADSVAKGVTIAAGKTGQAFTQAGRSLNQFGKSLGAAVKTCNSATTSLVNIPKLWVSQQAYAAAQDGVKLGKLGVQATQGLANATAQVVQEVGTIVNEAINIREAGFEIDIADLIKGISPTVSINATVAGKNIDGSFNINVVQDITKLGEALVHALISDLDALAKDIVQKTGQAKEVVAQQAAFEQRPEIQNPSLLETQAKQTMLSALKISIVKAMYGTDEAHTTNVTPQLIHSVGGKQLILIAPNSIANPHAMDKAFGTTVDSTQKNLLTITYAPFATAPGTTPYTAIYPIPEGVGVYWDLNPTYTEPTIEATYSSDAQHTKDVSAILQAQVHNGNINLTVGDNTFGPDIDPGKSKTLEISLGLGGAQIMSAQFAQGTNVHWLFIGTDSIRKIIENTSLTSSPAPTATA